MDDSVEDFLRELNRFEITSAEIVAFMNEQPRSIGDTQDFGSMSISKLSFQPLVGAKPRRETATMLRALALLSLLSNNDERFEVQPPTEMGWRGGPAFVVASMLPLQLFLDGSFGFDRSLFAAKVTQLRDA